MKSFKAFTVACLSVLTLCLFQGEAKAQSCVAIKVASLAPEGTTACKAIDAIKAELKNAPGGCIDIQKFCGGTAGEEKDVVRKMRIGQYHLALLTGAGLGLIDSEVRVVETPFLTQNVAEVNKLYDGMKPYFVDRFKAKGFELLGWAGIGYIQIFSNTPIKNVADLKGKKMWLMDGDPLAQSMYQAIGVVPTPLAITDVLTSLQTNLIDAAYAPPLGAIAFQWHTKAHYMTKIDLVYGTGGLVASNQTMAKLNAQQQDALRKAVQKQAAFLQNQAEVDNKESMATLPQAGVTIVTPTAADIAEIKKLLAGVAQANVGKLYSQAALDKALTILGRK